MQGQPGVRARPQQIRLQGGQLPRQLPLPARKPEIITLRQVPLGAQGPTKVAAGGQEAQGLRGVRGKVAAEDASGALA